MTLRDTHPFAHDVKRLFWLMNQRIDDELKPCGLGRSQWAVLASVAKAGELAQKDLQPLMRVEPATVTGIIDVLVGKGWLDRFESPSDKRMKVLRLTEDGRRRWSTIPDPVEAVERRMFADLSEDEISRMHQSMRRMIEGLEASRTPVAEGETE